MNVIYKYEIPIEDESWIAMPNKSATPHHVEVMDGKLYCWVGVDPDGYLTRNRKFFVRSTGQYVPVHSFAQFIGTARLWDHDSRYIMFPGENDPSCLKFAKSSGVGHIIQGLCKLIVARWERGSY